MLHCLDLIDSLGWLANLCFSKSVFLRLTLTFNSAKYLQNNDSESLSNHHNKTYHSQDQQWYDCPAQHYSRHKPRPSVPCSSNSLLHTLHSTKIPVFLHVLNFLVLSGILKYFKIFKGCFSSRSRSLGINNFSVVTLLFLLLKLVFRRTFCIFRSEEVDDWWMNLTERYYLGDG